MNTTTPPTRHPFKAQAASALCAVCGLSRLTVRHSTMGQNFDLLAERQRRAARRAKAAK